MTRHRITRTLTVLTLLVSTVAVGISVASPAAQAIGVTLPTSNYTVSVNQSSTSRSVMKYSGRGSWTNVELLNGQQAVPLFKYGSDQRVPFRTSVIVGDLAGATKVRAGLDGVAANAAPDECRGGTETEQAALTAYLWTGSAWGVSTGTLETHENENNGSGCRYLGVATGGATQVMFVVDLYCRDTNNDGTPTCDTHSGLVPGATNMMVEVEGSGDGIFNSGFAGPGSQFDNLVLDGSTPKVATLTSTLAHNLVTGDRIANLPGCGGFTFGVTRVDDGTIQVTDSDPSCLVTASNFRVRKVIAGSISSKTGSIVTVNATAHGLSAGDVITGLPSCDGQSFAVRSEGLLANEFTVEASCSEGSGGADVSKVARGDEAFEVVLGTDAVQRFVPEPTNDFVDSLTTSTTAFIDSTGSPANYRQWTGLMAVSLCTGAADAGPCLDEAPVGTDPDSTPTYEEGWSVMLLDEPEKGRFTVRPWRSAHPYYVSEGVSVSLSLRMPSGSFRDWFNVAFDDGLSSAFSSAQINSFGYVADDDYHTVQLSVTAREMSRVSHFDLNPSGQGDKFFTDECTGRLRVAAGGVVYIDENESGEYDTGEELVSDCQNENESESFAVDRVSLWGDSGSDDRAWVRAPGHDFTVGRTVTVCCAYGAFDGAQVVVAVGNPYGADGTTGGANDWFAFDTSTGSFDNQSFPRADGSSNPGWEVVTARAVARHYIRVTATSVTLDVSLSQVGPACPASICGFDIPSNQHLAGGFVSTNAQAFAFGPGMDSATPTFDFGVAGPSFTADGVERDDDGFFRACIPAGFLAVKFGGITAAAAAAQINGTTASSSANRNGALLATTATCGEPGGVLVRLDQFGFSAPYFAIRPRVASLGSTPTTTTSTTTPPASTTTLPPVTTVRTIPPNRIPGPGRVVNIGTAPSPRVADAVGVKASSNGLTLAIDPPSTTVRRGQTYVVTLVGPDGKQRILRLSPNNDRRNVVAAFRGLPPGTYRITVVVRNRNGTPAGRWTSPSIPLRG